MTRKIEWNPLDKKGQIWTAKYFVPSFISRTVALFSKSHKLLLVGPGAPVLGTLPPELTAGGNPAMVLLPNSYHYMGLRAWRKKYPGLIAVASPGGIPRLKRKGCQDIQGLELFQKELPDNITLLEPEGLGYGEVWLRQIQGPETAWIVCDAFFNYARFSRKPMARLLQKFLKAAPGLKMSSLVKYFLIKDRKRYKNWLFEQLDRDKPTLLVPAHGEILRAPDLPQQIRQLIEQRL